LREFQLKLEAIFKEFLEQGGIEVYGNLRIVIAHELVHLFVKRRHTRRFWKIVRIIYPEYEKGRKEPLKIEERAD